ncbi:B3 domain-containing transcription factor LEC2 [Linum grandiflorum]
MDFNHQPTLPPPSYIVPPTHHDSVPLNHHASLPIQPIPNPNFEGMINIWPQEVQNFRIENALRTKLARSKRKLARQRSLLNKSNSSSSSSGSNNPLVQRSVVKNDKSALLCDFSPRDNKGLRLLLTKVLKKSDVSALGRIILPKKETEENLPYLFDKEGIYLVIRDVYSTQEYTIRFKFWTNNKSRMYVLDNTGQLVKQNGVEIGDRFTLYEDENNKFYYGIQKPINPEQSQSATTDIFDEIQTSQVGDDEDMSLAVLIEQLEHREQLGEEETRSLLGIPSSSTVNGQT